MEGLTLHINDRTLQAALEHAKMKGIDLSVVVERFLLKFISEKADEIEKEIRISDEVKALVGILSPEESSRDWRDRKSDYLKSKYSEA